MSHNPCIPRTKQNDHLIKYIMYKWDWNDPDKYIKFIYKYYPFFKGQL